MKGFKIWKKKPLDGPFTHGGTGTSKCGTSTKSVLLVLSGLVPVPISVVLVPLSFLSFFLQQYQFIELSRMLHILDFTGCSLLSLLHTLSNLTCVRGTVYYTLLAPSRLPWSPMYSS